MQTKIIATIGPDTRDMESLKKIYKAGARIFRLNMSHGSKDWHAKTIENIQSVAADIEVMLDTKGPEIRTGDEVMTLNNNEKLVIYTKDKPKTKYKTLFSNYPYFAKTVKKWQIIVINEGKSLAEVIEIKQDYVITTVTQWGNITPKRHLNLPGCHLKIDILTKDDITNLSLVKEYKIHKVAASFVRNAEDIRTIRKLLKSYGSNAEIIAKIENQEGVDNIEEILKETDGIMVARWDLWVEVPWCTIPVIEEKLIKACNQADKFVIVATQMLSTMVKNPYPTRAEVTDVAVAVQFGADAVMLSDETANWGYPDIAVKTMKKIAEYAEQNKLTFDFK